MYYEYKLGHIHQVDQICQKEEAMCEYNCIENSLLSPKCMQILDTNGPHCKFHVKQNMCLHTYAFQMSMYHIDSMFSRYLCSSPFFFIVVIRNKN